MSKFETRTAAALLVLSASLAGPAVGSSQELTGFRTPWYGAPQDLVEGPDGAIWFTDFSLIGNVDQAGAFRAFTVASDGPAGIAVGSDGNLWFPTSRWNGSQYEPRIARITPSGTLTEFALPAVANRIVRGPDENLWFIEKEANRLGRMTTSGSITEFPVPTASAGLEGLAVGLDGNLWFTEFAAGKIGRMTPGGDVTEYPFPSPNPNPVAIAAGPDGNLWVALTALPRAARITPAGELTLFPMPRPSHRVVAGKDGHLWFLGIEGSLWRVSTEGAVTPVATIPPPVPNNLAVGSDGSLWMASGDGWDYPGTIYRFALEIGDCTADATTLCLNRGRFRVTADWKSPGGASGSARAAGLTSDSGYFWFFDPASVELVIKVLNGCAANQNYWVFGGGLTNVEVHMRVTDTQSGFSKEYSNAQGTPFAPIQDTAALSVCP